MRFSVGSCAPRQDTELDKFSDLLTVVSVSALVVPSLLRSLRYLVQRRRDKIKVTIDGNSISIDSMSNEDAAQILKAFIALNPDPPIQSET
jgi:hypothetical protein